MTPARYAGVFVCHYGVIAVTPSFSEVVPVRIHDLRPRGDEVVDEFAPGVRASVDFGERAQFGVRAEDEIDARAG